MSGRGGEREGEKEGEEERGSVNSSDGATSSGGGAQQDNTTVQSSNKLYQPVKTSHLYNLYQAIRNNFLKELLELLSKCCIHTLKNHIYWKEIFLQITVLL